jgi:hypothetical protein
MSMLLFLQCDLWSIIGDSGFVVSSLVSSASASFSFHLLTGKMGTRPLATVTQNRIRFGASQTEATMLTTPTPLQQQAFDLLQVSLTM